MDKPFRPAAYFRPKDPAEAVALLATHGSGARLLAGGTDLLARRSPTVETLVDIGFTGLDFIAKDEDGSVRIGAATPVGTLEHAEVLSADPLKALGEAASSLATPTIRNMATVGGNACNASPAGDLCAVLLALDATLIARGPKGLRELPAGTFFRSMNLTALEDDELLTEIRIPAFPERTGSSFVKLRHHQTSVDMAVVNVATRLTLEEGRCADAAIAMGAVGPTPLRAGMAEKGLIGRRPVPDALEGAARTAMGEASPVDDLRSSADYRRRMVGVLVRRALETSLRRCGA